MDNRAFALEDQESSIQPATNEREPETDHENSSQDTIRSSDNSRRSSDESGKIATEDNVQEEVGNEEVGNEEDCADLKKPDIILLVDEHQQDQHLDDFPQNSALLDTSNEKRHAAQKSEKAGGSFSMPSGQQQQQCPNKKAPACPFPWRYRRQKCVGRSLLFAAACFIFFLMLRSSYSKYHNKVADKQSQPYVWGFYFYSEGSLVEDNGTLGQGLQERYFSKALHQRHLRSKRQSGKEYNNTVIKEETGGTNKTVSSKNKGVKEISCTTSHNFPDDPFLLFNPPVEVLVTIHLCIAIYMFCAVAVVCDVYFVPALEHICEDLGLQADVAGATFMAGASSAPELCTSIIGVFLAQSDVGLGAIVGSSIFNLLAIIGCCGIFGGMPIALSWYPLSRDSIFYLISIFEMIAFMSNRKIFWYESLVMVVTYGFYILWMVFNPKIEKWAKSKVGSISRRVSQFRMESSSGSEKSTKTPGKEEVIRLGMLEARRHSRISVDPLRMRPVASAENDIPLRLTPSGLRELDRMGLNVTDVASHMDTLADDRDIEISEYVSPFLWPDTYIAQFYYILMLPITIIHALTIPDSRRLDTWQAKAYMVSFFLSVMYIAAYSYIMVWVSSLAGSYVGIPDTVVGLTILAAGTSVPDMLASIFVARDGYGDMAISNAVGSNVFDILIGLGIPWFIDAMGRKHEITIDSAGMMYACITLVVTVLYVWLSLQLNNWTLTVWYGTITLVVYFITITICIMIEMNVFFTLNSEEC